jgi:hypothetical protein
LEIMNTFESSKVRSVLSPRYLWFFLSLAAITTAGGGSDKYIPFQVTPVGSLTGRAILHVQDQDNNRFEVQIIIDVGYIPGTDDFAKRLATVPSDEISAWILTDRGQSLHLKTKSPPPGRHPVGVGKNGSGHIFFQFDHAETNKAMAVVIKFKDEYKVFPLSTLNSK